MVGAKGFEPSTSWSRTRRASQAALRPDRHAPPQFRPRAKSTFHYSLDVATATTAKIATLAVRLENSAFPRPALHPSCNPLIDLNVQCKTKNAGELASPGGPRLDSSIP